MKLRLVFDTFPVFIKKALVDNLHQFKEYGSWRILAKFLHYSNSKSSTCAAIFPPINLIDRLIKIFGIHGCSLALSFRRLNVNNFLGGAWLLRHLFHPSHAATLSAPIYIFIRLDGQLTAHNTQLENTIKHNHTQLKER